VVDLVELRRAVSELGLSNAPVCLHTSLSSFGYVEGGAAMVLEGFLSEGCTVLVPAFAYVYLIPPPPEMRPERNGWNYETFPFALSDTRLIYTPESNEIDLAEMGAVPAEVLEMPGRARGNNPLNSFAAVGILAKEVISGQDPLDVYAPLWELTKRDGWIVMIGVDLTKMTFIHYAEQEVGRTLFRRWARGGDGHPRMVAIGSCSEGFGKFESIFKPFVRTKRVGESLWHAYPAQDILHAAVKAIREDPILTHCGDPNCARCRDAVQGGPIL
jgi:aminoglycoside N3'-acetyltransferase